MPSYLMKWVLPLVSVIEPGNLYKKLKNNYYKKGSSASMSYCETMRVS